MTVRESPPSTAILLAAMMIVLGNTAGCQSGNSLSLQKVHGSVKYRGKPLDHGQVVFVPEQGTPGPPTIGVIRADGSFRMRTDEKEGAAQGRYHVMVHCREARAPSTKPQMVLLKSLIPEKYSNESSPLYFEVKPGENECPLSLE
jgi:hypothetical protein